MRCRRETAFRFADPLCEGDSEHGGAGLRRKGGGRLAYASRAQGLGDRCGEASELVQLAFPERGVLVDHGLPHAGVRAALIGEKRCRPVQRGGDDLERGGVRRAASTPSTNAWRNCCCP